MAVFNSGPESNTSLCSKVKWIVGISGASGTIYSRRLLQILVENNINVDLIISEGGYRVLQEEDRLEFSSKADTVTKLIGYSSDLVRLHNNRDTGACIASGSFETQGMIVIPCSMNTLAGIAHGFGDNLLKRAADVTLKEGRKLILVPRETPLTAIHLRNLLQLAELGVKIVPPMPGFYTQPKSLEELINHFVMRVLDQMGISTSIAPRWRADER